MPPPDRYDEDRDLPRRLRFSDPIVIVALIAGGLLVAGCVVVGGFAVLWSTAESDRRPPAGAQADTGGGLRGTPKVYTRQEFRDLVMGKTEEEVIAAVGKPDHTEKDEFGAFWHYRGRTTDPATGKTDPGARLEFKDGRVSDLIF